MSGKTMGQVYCIKWHNPYRPSIFYIYKVPMQGKREKKMGLFLLIIFIPIFIYLFFCFLFCTTNAQESIFTNHDIGLVI